MRAITSGPGIPTIYKFRDYRRYLRAYVEYRRRRAGYSLAQFSRDVGFKSANYAGLILDGKRNLTVGDTHQVGRLIGLSDSEIRFFGIMVQYTDASTKEEKSFYRRWLKESAEKGAVSILKPSDSPLLISSWLVPAALSCLHASIGCSVQTAARLAHVSTDQMQRAFDVLTESKLARRLGDDYFLEIESVTNAQFGKYFQFAEFQKIQMQRSLHALKNYQSNGAKFISNTFLLDDDGYEDLLRRVRDMINSVDATQAASSSTQLKQLNLQLFGFENGAT